MSFLTPQDRALLLENLRPPKDYRLDLALTTTYSLDLIALMVAPVGFTLFEIDPGAPDFQKTDPLEVLEAVRRHASQIVVFHEAGRISVPRHYRPLLTYLEDRLIAVKAPRKDCAFHPKVWIVRYVNNEKAVTYRLLCLSRNLTFDRCWDTIFSVDGPLRADREMGFSYNADLRKFVAALPGMSDQPVAKAVRAQVATIEKEIARVEWDLEGLPFEEMALLPIGYDGASRWPFKERLERVVIVSPFLSNRTLAKLTKDARKNVLVSRPESLDKTTDAALEGFDAVYQMSDALSTADAPDDDQTLISDAPLQGLHAKLYVADDGWNAHTWTGSANATSAAFDGNVEFLVQLTGLKSKVGVDVFLEKLKGSASFLNLLEPYQRPESPPDNEAQEALEKELDDLRAPIASAGWKIALAAGTEANTWTALATTDKSLPTWAKHVKASCHPLSLGSVKHDLKPKSVVSIDYGTMALESLSSYVVVEIEGSTKDAKHAIRFLVNAELVGAPANRRDQLLRHMLRDKQSVLRFLLLLLTDIAEDVGEASDSGKGKWSGSSWSSTSSEALFEPLIRALDRSPARLATIQSLLQELGATEEGRLLIPEGLTQLFDAVWAAREPSK